MRVRVRVRVRVAVAVRVRVRVGVGVRAWAWVRVRVQLLRVGKAACGGEGLLSTHELSAAVPREQARHGRGG